MDLTPDLLTWIWLGIAIFLGILELISVSVVAIWFMIGALVTIPLTFFDISLSVQLFWFTCVSLILLLTTRPFAIKYFKIGKEKTNIDTLIEAEGVVLKNNETHECGELKIEGKVWRFQSLSQTIYQPSETVVIREIKGVTLWVD